MSRSTSLRRPRRARAGTVAAAVIATGAMTVVVAPVLSSVSGAADPTVTPIVVADTVETLPIVSDDGNLVLLTSVSVPDPSPDPTAPPFVPVTTVRLHDRAAGTTTDLPDADARFAAMSGDGCTIAYAVPVDPAPGAGPEAPNPQPELRVVDRCGPDAPAPIPLVSATIGSSTVAGPLALDVDGDTLIVDTGDDVVRWTRTLATDVDPATPFVEAERFDLDPVASDESVTSGRVDVSDDGAVVVYEATEVVVPAPPDPPVPSVYAWQAGEVTLVAPDATHPSISGDGRLVVVDLRAAATPLAAGVTVVDLAAADPADAVTSIDETGDLPVISADGAHVFYVVPSGPTAGLRRATWAGDGTEPFDVVVGDDLGVPIDGDDRFVAPTTGPAASRHGDVIASDDSTSGDVLVRAAPPSAVFGAAQYDLGSGDVGAALSGAATLTNDGASTIDVGAATVAVGSPFTIAAPGPAGTCDGRLRPGASCTITVEYVVPAAIDAIADLTVTFAGEAAPAATTQFLAVGTTTTTSTTATTTTTTVRPVNTTPNTTPNTTRTTTRVTTGTTPRATTRVTTTTVPVSQPSFSPASFEFAPTIVEAGRRTASIALSNPSTTAAQVTALRLDPDDGAFEVGSGTDCVGASLAAGSSCRVDVLFAPQIEGPTTVTLIATFADGDEISTAVSGFGAPLPVVAVVPGVASTGQVVTVRGSGFPAGAIVEVAVGSTSSMRTVAISDVGGFDVPVVVLPNTTPGPLVVTVPAQADLFPAIETSFLVTFSSDRTSPAVLRSVGPNIGR